MLLNFYTQLINFYILGLNYTLLYINRCFYKMGVFMRALKKYLIYKVSLVIKHIDLFL